MTLAIDLSDCALAFARAGQVLRSAPSAIFDGSTAERAGVNAWGALRRQPTATSTRHLAAVLAGAAGEREAALLAAELRERLSSVPIHRDEPIWLAAPASAQAPGLGAFLAVAREVELGVSGFVDAATACVAALALDRPALVLELGLHHVAATAIERVGHQVSRRRTVLSRAGGWIEVQQSWLELIARLMVQQTRFDPLHEGASEQQLFDALRPLAREAQAHGFATASLQGSTLKVAVTRDQLAQASQGLRREVMQLVHGLRQAGRPLVLVAPAAMCEVPGLHEDLDSLAGCELIALPEGFAAAAVCLLDLPARKDGDPVRLLRRLPIPPASTQLPGTLREPLGTRRAAGPPPSHLLLEGQAHALSGEPLVVGRAPQELPGYCTRTLRLAEGLAGVSRRHCTFLTAAGEVLLLDHSRFGTFVNGERVAERVRVHAGDRVRLGDPGVELALIAVGDPPAGAAS